MSSLVVFKENPLSFRRPTKYLLVSPWFRTQMGQVNRPGLRKLGERPNHVAEKGCFSKDYLGYCHHKEGEWMLATKSEMNNMEL